MDMKDIEAEPDNQLLLWKPMRLGSNMVLLAKYMHMEHMANTAVCPRQPKNHDDALDGVLTAESSGEDNKIRAYTQSITAAEGYTEETEGNSNGKRERVHSLEKEDVRQSPCRMPACVIANIGASNFANVEPCDGNTESPTSKSASCSSSDSMLVDRTTQVFAHLDCA